MFRAIVFGLKTFVTMQTLMILSTNELPEVDAIIVALCEEGVNDPIAKWVYGQLGDTKKVLPGQSSAITAILNGGNR